MHMVGPFSICSIHITPPLHAHAPAPRSDTPVHALAYLQWVAAAKCQVPLPLLRQLLEGMAPNLRRLSATQLQRCVRAGGVLHQRGEAPPNR